MSDSGDQVGQGVAPFAAGAAAGKERASATVDVEKFCHGTDEFEE